MRTIKIMNCDVVILDYAIPEIRFVNLPADLTNADAGEVEEYLSDNCDYDTNTCYWMGASNARQFSVSLPDETKIKL